MTQQRINLWSSPRNISTAIMYSFAQRADTKVVDEPLYAHYLRHQATEADHPGREAILSSQENDGNKVVQQMLSVNYGRSAVVFKQMTHHLVALELDFLEQMQNVLLIRNPRAILKSFSKVVTRVTAEDIGLPQQYQLFLRLQAAGKLAAVVDSRQLLLNPASVLQQLCERLNLEYSEAMLNWNAGARPEDGIWAPYWYTNVHQSTGFKPWVEKEITLTPALEAIAEACMPAYEDMLTAALAPN